MLNEEKTMPDGVEMTSTSANDAAKKETKVADGVEMASTSANNAAKKETKVNNPLLPKKEQEAIATTAPGSSLERANKTGCVGQDDNEAKFEELLRGVVRSEGNENFDLLDFRGQLQDLSETTRYTLLKSTFPDLNSLKLAQAITLIEKDMTSRIGFMEQIPVLNIFYLIFLKSINTSAESVLAAIDQIGMLSTLLYGGAAAWAAGADNEGYEAVLDRFGRTANSSDGAEFYNLCQFGGEKEFSDVIESSGWWLIRNFNTATTMGISCTIMVALLAVLARSLASVTGFDQETTNDPNNKMYVMALKINLIMMTALMLTALYYSIVAERFWRMMTMPNFALEKEILRCDDPFGLADGLYGDFGQVLETRDSNYWAHYYGWSAVFVFFGMAFFMVSLGIGISLKSCGVAGK